MLRMALGDIYVLCILARPPAAEAQGRPHSFIQKVLKAMGPAAGTEWHHLDGATLLRVYGKLSPSMNAQYTAAFGK